MDEKLITWVWIYEAAPLPLNSRRSATEGVPNCQNSTIVLVREAEIAANNNDFAIFRRN